MAEKRLQIQEIASETGITEFQNKATRKDIPVFADMANNELVQKAHLLGYAGGSPVVINLDSSQPSLYTVTAPQLAAVNSLGKIPNFTAISLASGQQFSDIYPIYNPPMGFGVYTQIQIVLHDGGGTNAEDTVVQFS